MSQGPSGAVDERRRLALLALVSLVPCLLLAAWARFWSPAPWESEVLNALALQSGLSGDVGHGINTLGSLPVWSVVVVIAAIAMAVVRGIAAAFLVGLSFASDLAAYLVKLLVERDRPETAAVEQFFGTDSFSYPSGHTVRATALVGVVVWLVAPVRLRLPLAVTGALIAGLLMGYARVALGVHWPTDTLGGTLLGIGWFALTVMAMQGSLDRGMHLQRWRGPRA